MTLKDKIENHLGLVVSSVFGAGLLLGFGAGMKVEQWFKEAVAPASSIIQCKAEIWKPLAQKADWLPMSQCPAYPLKMQISSPGNGTTVSIGSINKKTISTPFILSISRPLIGDSALGFVVKPSSSPNYYVIFPFFEQTKETNSYRTRFGLELPINIQNDSKYEIRGLLIDKKDKLGDRFLDISQITDVDPSVVLTDAITVGIEN